MNRGVQKMCTNMQLRDIFDGFNHSVGLLMSHRAYGMHLDLKRYQVPNWQKISEIEGCNGPISRNVLKIEVSVQDASLYKMVWDTYLMNLWTSKACLWIHICRSIIWWICVFNSLDVPHYLMTQKRRATNKKGNTRKARPEQERRGMQCKVAR